MKKAIVTFLAAVTSAATIMADTPTVSDVSARQRYPWNGYVDVDYTLSGDTTDLKVAISIRDMQNGATYLATNFLQEVSAEEGSHRVTWDPAADGVTIVSTNVVAVVSLLRAASVAPTSDSPYCVIDLSGGSDASSYPVEYLSEIPSGGWTDEHKTTKLVLRLVEPGSFQMGGSYQVTITKPYYIGVFEVTQKQYELVAGTNTCSSTSYGMGDAYPVHYVSYDMIRGSSSGAQWPSSSEVDADSFVGRLRDRTGIDFDLPTEAQWEYACRAGTATTYSWGDSMNGGYCWYKDNAGGAAHPVGAKTPNAWGLYDMSGNVWEMCLDWYGSLSGDVADPVGATSGAHRVNRGGSWKLGEGGCSASMRNGCAPSNAGDSNGFRLSCPAEL